jgi:hypothetical protein
MSSYFQTLNVFQTIDRYRFLMILNAANQCNEYQFEKEAAMLWLVNYPGDLHVKYHQAMAFAHLGQQAKAVACLEKLMVWDPMFPEPSQALSQLAASAEQRSYHAAVYQYLEQKTTPMSSSVQWLAPLWDARDAYSRHDFEAATALVHESMVLSPTCAIPAILHLQIVKKMDNPEMLNNLSEIYHQQWPNCLQINVIRALMEMEFGLEGKAVERLHWVAAHDSAGQVIESLMGPDHPFRNLWPERLEIHFDLPVPASVSAFLGWNKLNTGKVETPTFKTPAVAQPRVQTGPEDVTQKINIDPEPIHAVQTLKDKQLDPEPVRAEESLVEEQIELEHEIPLKTTHESWATEEDFEEIQSVFANIAKRLKKPDLERADNRFPVYVVMSSKGQLEKTYGPNTARVINELLVQLVNLIQGLPDWGATLFYPDDPESLSPLGIKPVFGTDPWQTKLALADLDAALARRGEMVGALLIVGGPEIIPFHHLPNPTFDNDLDVASDNPYACIDENYFIAQWPVGRLPGEAGTDAGLLLAQIRTLIYQYEQRSKYGKPLVVNFAALINSILQIFSTIGSNFNHRKHNFGYSAEIWQKASAEVYKTVGDAKDLQLSPPIQAHSLSLNNHHGLRAGYFNLHGVKDGPHWYGQKDFNSPSNGPDYPIALSPEMFDENNPSPKLILSEACYGANIYDKRYDEALSLKCLDTGTVNFIGSTCIAYGSITPPLIAADYLADMFWKNVLEGLPAGYALMQAKLSLAEEMTKTQGFLDGEDQKTLLSFVLYGDPLAFHDGLQTMPKPLFRFKSYPTLKTLSDSDMISANDSKDIPKQVNKQVKKVVEKYLPGLEHAQMQYKKSANTPVAKNGVADGEIPADSPERYVVTLRKTIDENQETAHHHFARMTFDKKGKLVKFTTSR